MVEQGHGPEECEKAGKNASPDSQLGRRKEGRGDELHHAHNLVKLARISLLPKPRAQIARSGQVDYRGNRKDRGQAVGKQMRNTMCPHGRLLSHCDREIAQDTRFQLNFLKPVFHDIAHADDAGEPAISSTGKWRIRL